MNPQQTQLQNPQMTADESAASLAFATHLQDQMIPRQTSSQTPQDGPGQEKPKEMENNAISKLTDEVEGLRKDMQNDPVKKEINSIRAELEALLNEDGNK